MASPGDSTATAPAPGAGRSRAPRDSATVVIVRDGTAGLEVLLLLRAERGDYNSGAWVYPGGIVDPADRTAGPVFGGLTDAQASRRLGLPDGGLAYYRAAVRECYEEAGILFATGPDGELAPPDDEAAEQVAALREDVRQGRRTIDALCDERGLVPAPQRLHYIAHWVTPLARPKRFDTRFFLAIVPPGQSAVHDQQETQDHVWLTPAEALAPGNARRTLNVTRTILRMLVPFGDTTALAGWAASPREVRRVLPWLALEAGELRLVRLHGAAYAEVALLDPEGKGNAWCELRPDVAVRLTPHVLRVPAREGGNTYLVGQAGRWLVL
ncbi:MAG: NUDIX hydrolase, partial [Comamonadaceae bacterium]